VFILPYEIVFVLQVLEILSQFMSVLFVLSNLAFQSHDLETYLFKVLSLLL
jgi:hypothetical protein